MNIFLTGNTQVGKSTLISRVLEVLPGVETSGFKTITAADVPGAVGSVYIIPANGDAGETGDFSRVGIRLGAGRGRKTYPEVFDRRGVEILENAEKSRLVIMDEIGRMEADSPLFIARVKELLSCETPVFGVLRKEGDTPLQEYIRNSPDTRLFEVTEENREELFGTIRSEIRRELGKRVDSAGAFIFRQGDNGRELLMVEGRRGWSMPKGHIEYGETPEEAALREVREETGIEAEIIPGFSFKTVSGLKGEHRAITYFKASYKGGTLKAQTEEVKSAAWIPAEKCEGLLRFKEDVPALRAALEE